MAARNVDPEDTFEQWRQETNNIASDAGDVSSLNNGTNNLTTAINTNTPVQSGNSGKFLSTDGTSVSWVNVASTSYTHPNHTGDVTSTGDGATVITADSVNESKLNISNAPTDGYVLTANSSGTGGLTWAATAVSYTHPNHSGDVTSTGDGATVITADSVNESKLNISNAPTNGYVLTADAAVTGGLKWTVGSSSNITTKPLFEHTHTLTANYSISGGNNALTAGPITINTGVSVTVPTGSTWVIA
jgi:hypothetical protein